ncbi:MAG: hypothetical protein M1269_13460 [Chloroflexi bacterium]|nr:hypothetical protein [Chloroflexota bacterium]
MRKKNSGDISRPAAIGGVVAAYVLPGAWLIFSGQAMLVIVISAMLLMAMLAIFKIRMDSTGKPLPDYMVGLAVGALISLVGSFAFIIYKIASINRF